MDEKSTEINISNDQSQNYNITNSELEIQLNFFLAIVHVFLFFLFIRVLYILHIKYCAFSRNNENVEHNQAIAPFINEYVNISPNNDDICSICLEKLNINKVIKLKCNHLFHEKCIQQWLSIKNICPLCNGV